MTPSAGSSGGKGKAAAASSIVKGTIWPMDAAILRAAVEAELREIKEGQKKADVGVVKTLESMAQEEGDLVMWIGHDGTIAMRSVVVSVFVVLRQQRRLTEAEHRSETTHFAKVPPTRASLPSRHTLSCRSVVASGSSCRIPFIVSIAGGTSTETSCRHSDSGKNIARGSIVFFEESGVIAYSSFEPRRVRRRPTLARYRPLCQNAQWTRVIGSYRDGRNRGMVQGTFRQDTKGRKSASIDRRQRSLDRENTAKAECDLLEGSSHSILHGK